MIRHCLSTSLFLLLMSLPARAEVPQTTPSCTDSLNEQALLLCRKKAFAATTSLLTTDIEKLKRRFRQDEPERLRLLVAAQKAWANYRDAECHMQTFESRGGSAFRIYELDCLTNLSRARLETIRQLLDTP